jgi:uncharacterized protein (TIGR02118 family)
MGAIKMVACVRRRGDLSYEEFSRYWREDHRKLVVENLGALNVRRYAQNHLISPDFGEGLAQSRGMATDHYDGVLELWWDDMATLTTAFASPEGQAASALFAEDEANFIDLSRSKVFLTEEHIMLDVSLRS